MEGELLLHGASRDAVIKDFPLKGKLGLNTLVGYLG